MIPPPIGICITSGIVRELVPRGFILQINSEEQRLVTTMTDGRRLKLRAGDQVRVSGGPDHEGNFASATIYKQLANEKEIKIPDAPRGNLLVIWLRRLRH